MALLTVKELERDSKISEYTWRKWIASGKVPSVLLGRRRRVTEEDYRRFIRRGKRNGHGA
jgi:excisionase family DNA binding protein